MPSGRSPPPGFGIITRRTGAGRYVFATSSVRSPASHSSTPSASIAAKLTPSTPGAPPLARARAARHGAACPRGRSCRRAGRSGTPAPPSPCDTASSEVSGYFRVLPGSSPITDSSTFFESTPEVRALPSTGITRLQRYYDPVRLPPAPLARRLCEVATLMPERVSPVTRITFPTCRAHYPGGPDGCVCRLLPHPLRPSPYLRRVGIRNFTFEACSGFTRVTAHRIAQPPKAAFVTRLRPGQLPGRTARQLPDPTDNFLGGSFLHW